MKIKGNGVLIGALKKAAEKVCYEVDVKMVQHWYRKGYWVPTRVLTRYMEWRLRHAFHEVLIEFENLDKSWRPKI